jgi:DNA-directed RNA polymerase alpha subunit
VDSGVIVTSLLGGCEVPVLVVMEPQELPGKRPTPLSVLEQEEGEEAAPQTPTMSEVAMVQTGATMVAAAEQAEVVMTWVVERGAGVMVATAQSSSSATDGMVNLRFGRCKAPGFWTVS